MQMRRNGGFSLRRISDNPDYFSCRYRPGSFNGVAWIGVAIYRMELPFMVIEYFMADKYGFPQEIAVKFSDFSGPGGWDPDAAIDHFNLTGGILKPAEIYAFMGSRPGLLIPPPLSGGIELHARLEDPLLKARHIRLIIFQQEFKESAFYLIRGQHRTFFGNCKFQCVNFKRYAYFSPLVNPSLA